VRARQFVKFVGPRLITMPQLVNFAKMKDIVLTMDENETVIVRKQNKITRNRGTGGVSIISQPEDKT